MMTDFAGEFKLKRKNRNTDKKQRQTCENRFFKVYLNNHWPLQVAVRIKECIDDNRIEQRGGYLPLEESNFARGLFENIDSNLCERIVRSRRRFSNAG